MCKSSICANNGVRRIALTVTRRILGAGMGHANTDRYFLGSDKPRAMNTVKFRKDRKHKSRDKRRIVGGILNRCKFRCLALPRRWPLQLSFLVARNFQWAPCSASSQFQKDHTVRTVNSGADFGFLDDDEITRILGKNNDLSAKNEITGSSLCRISSSCFSRTHVVSLANFDILGRLLWSETN